ncbi:hypothetical protein GR294_24505 [Raoultella sp. Lac2]|uniref:hypothetical protein n=1 Tax=unclassified Raoultella TaxID=2627600 RepID=UPI0013552DB0|nr:hypothetical protein [Raoultella sp. Lac2]MXF99279.1 hypothetical protein [Raoultella sp. Lac1]
MQVKDVNKISVLKRIAEIEASGRTGTCFIGYENSVGTAMPDGSTEKFQLSVMKNLISKRLVDGCCCGCRGDFTLTEKGLLALDAESDDRKET